MIRDSLDAHELAAGHALLLTSCFSASSINMDNIEWSDVLPLLHSVNLMSYDFFGSWDATTNHNAPLYAPAQGDPAFNLHAAVQQLIQVYQVPAQKINAGLAFYGRSVKTQGQPLLFGPSLMQPDNTTFWEDDGSPLYYNILLKMNLFTPMYDNQAKVPYLTGTGSLQTFVSYDDATSIADKASYIVTHGLQGAIIWEMTGDYVETSPGSGVVAGTPLADTLNAVFCSSVTSVSEIDESSSRFTLNEDVLCPPDLSTSWSLDILGLDGRLISRHPKLNGIFNLKNLSLPSGLYLTRGYQGNRCQVIKWIHI